MLIVHCIWYNIVPLEWKSAFKNKVFLTESFSEATKLVLGEFGNFLNNN